MTELLSEIIENGLILSRDFQAPQNSFSEPTLSPI
ncbi:hypothetical protein FHU41_001913 [Psychromicrobium silvestre]|uniref:Uncharacterized protein n=1 Tax=Psychromicrobium silvestre TaxID=1645614 RepID=A0A7Y9LU45_9MICC|nr:hypothetical protein [Psychromicrobium silvestre]